MGSRVQSSAAIQVRGRADAPASQRTRTRGSPPVWATLHNPAVLGLYGFWGGLCLAARSYPRGYDWQYTTISSLLYAERNPEGFLWARAGLVLCGVLGLYWTLSLLPLTSRVAARPYVAGIRTLQLGYLCMICCALLPERSLHLPRDHDMLALAAFLGLCIGTALTTFGAIVRIAAERRLRARPWMLASVLAGLVLSPLVLAALAQAYVAHAFPALPWVNRSWRARGVPAWLSFAFWEWVTCAVLSLYLAALSRITAGARSFASRNPAADA
jgi:hypothetical protein